MRQVIQKGLAVLFCANLIALITGCEEANQSDAKKHRLIAAENKQLQVQLQAETQRRDKEIQKLKDLLAQSEKERQDLQQMAEKEKQDLQQKAEKERKDLQHLVEKEKQDCQQKIDAEMKERIESVLVAAMEEASKVSEENERLKAEIKQLKSKKDKSEQSGISR